MYQQSTSYECGPYALKHALQMLGIFTDERRLGSLAGTSSAGTDEVQLARAADRLGCDLPMVRATAADDARRTLTAQLARGLPALLCVDQWEHWVAVVGGDGARFSVLDSANPRVVVTLDWEHLRARWGYLDRRPDGTPLTVFDAHPVVPRGAPAPRGLVAPETAAALGGGDLAELVRDWPAYTGDLLALVAPAAPGNGEPSAVALSDLLAELRRPLLDRAAGARLSRRVAADAQLERVRLVARTYGLRVLREKSAPVLAGVADLIRRLLD